VSKLRELATHKQINESFIFLSESSLIVSSQTNQSVSYKVSIAQRIYFVDAIILNVTLIKKLQAVRV
jgi:hypothetical protein